MSGQWPWNISKAGVQVDDNGEGMLRVNSRNHLSGLMNGSGADDFQVNN